MCTTSSNIYIMPSLVVLSLIIVHTAYQLNVIIPLEASLFSPESIFVNIRATERHHYKGDSVQVPIGAHRGT